MSNIIIQEVLPIDNELGTIKINLNSFISLLKIRENDTESIPSSLIKKSIDLQNTYNCFAANYDARSLWEKKKFIASKIRGKENKPAKSKIYIISNDFTDETKYKKEFTGYLNKLTDVNKNVIYSKIKLFIANINSDFYKILFDIIWNFIKVSSNTIYIDVLYLFNNKFLKEKIETIWESYIVNKEWIPCDTILNNNVLSSSDDKYDEYCDYVKWKKSSISIIRAWCYILEKENTLFKLDILLDNLTETLTKYLNNKSKTYKHIMDILLDQIYTILDNYKNKKIISYIKSLDITKFENSSKYKIINILEK